VSALVRPEPRRGLYEDAFWDYVQHHELRLQKCADCGAHRYPPSAVCPHCLSPEYAWDSLSGKGRVLSWVVFHRQYFRELPIPYAVVAVEMTEGPILLANLVSSSDTLPRIGMPVSICFETALNSEGEKWEIYQFEPLREVGSG
jgi:uncharacterized OB-fold protein